MSAAARDGMAATVPLIAGDPATPIAWRHGRPVSRGQYLADVERLASRLPASGAPLAMTADRYRFALALGAAALRGQAGLLPPNHTPDMIARLRQHAPSAYTLHDADAPAVALPGLAFADDGDDAVPSPQQRGTVPSLRADAIAAQVYTSGSTGVPMVHAKPWGALVADAQAQARRLQAHLGGRSLDGAAIVGTVPPHHMYGFESTVLLAMQCGAAFAAERPFFAADIAASLARLPRPRLLVITPFHLKALLDARLVLPAVDLVLSATAPLSPQLAARAEAALDAPLIEIYGCTEAGQVATRRTTQGDLWTTYDGLRIDGDGSACSVSGGHVAAPTPLADALEVVSAERFRLLGRANDSIGVAGKRSSLSALNFHLNSIAGVQDGAFWMPPDAPDGVARPVAFVVAPGVATEALLGELRLRIDAALLPRRVVRLDALPRDATGKLPLSRLAGLAEERARRAIDDGSAAASMPSPAP